MDLLLEIGHSFSHTDDYASGKMKVHSHKIGDRVVVHHDHKILKKIEEAVDNLGGSDADEQMQNIKILQFDQVKQIIQENPLSRQEFGHSEYDFYYQLRLDYVWDKLPTPPPQSYTS